MEFLKKLPTLFKQHYEKVLLGLSLAALALAGFFLASVKQQAEEDLKQYEIKLGKKKTFPHTNINWAEHREAMAKGTNPANVNFSPPHNLFNPVTWKRRPDGSLLKVEKGTEVGPEALKVIKITPLYLTINLDRTTSGGTGYFMGLTKETATNAALRRKFQFYVAPNEKDRTGTFALREVKGTPDNPELGLELLDTGEKGTVTKDQPFKRVDGYTVDLSYPPENSSFKDRRLNDSIHLGGEDYNIVAITQNEVVMSARSNNKRTTLTFNAAP